jgi:hypothetical protein
MVLKSVNENKDMQLDYFTIDKCNNERHCWTGSSLVHIFLLNTFECHEREYGGKQFVFCFK